MGKLSTVIFKGKSGKDYKFIVYSWDTNFKENYGGVYFITKRYKNSSGNYSHERIYVGQSEDLSSRFDNHHKQKCFEDHDANCKCVYGEQNEDTRLEIESDLIENYSLPCND